MKSAMQQLKEKLQHVADDIDAIANRRYFVNIYADANGRFLGDEDYVSYKEAFNNRDQLSTYIETVEIVRK